MSNVAINCKVGNYPCKTGIRHYALKKAFELNLSGFLNYSPDASLLFIHVEGVLNNIENFVVFLQTLAHSNNLSLQVSSSIEMGYMNIEIVYDPENHNLIFQEQISNITED